MSCDSCDSPLKFPPKIRAGPLPPGLTGPQKAAAEDSPSSATAIAFNHRACPSPHSPISFSEHMFYPYEQDKAFVPVCQQLRTGILYEIISTIELSQSLSRRISPSAGSIIIHSVAAAASSAKAAHIAHHEGTDPSGAEIPHPCGGIAVLGLPLLVPAAAVLELLHQAAVIHIVRLHGRGPLGVLQRRHIVPQA